MGVRKAGDMNLFDCLLVVMGLIFAYGVSWGIWRGRQEHKRNCDCRQCWDRNLQKAFRMWEREEAQRRGEHPRTCGCRPCFERRLRSGGIP